MYLHTLTWFSLSLFFFFSPGWISLSSEVRCTTLFIIFVLLCWICSNMFMSLLYWGAQKRIQQSKCASSGLNREEGSPPLTCWHCSPVASQDIFELCCEGPLLAYSQLDAWQNSQGFLSKAAFQPAGLQCALLGHSPQVQVLVFPFAELHKLEHFSG